MSNTIIKQLLTNLINNKFYNTENEIMEKLDIYFAVNRLSKEDYEELSLLVISVYRPEPEPTPEPIEDIIDPSMMVEPENVVEPDPIVIPEEVIPEEVVTPEPNVVPDETVDAVENVDVVEPTTEEVPAEAV